MNTHVKTKYKIKIVLSNKLKRKQTMPPKRITRKSAKEFSEMGCDPHPHPHNNFSSNEPSRSSTEKPQVRITSLPSVSISEPITAPPPAEVKHHQKVAFEEKSEGEEEEDYRDVDDDDSPSSTPNEEDVEDGDEGDGDEEDVKMKKENSLNDLSESAAGCSSNGDMGLKKSNDMQNTIFCIEFSTGYIFRQFVEFSKRVSKELPLAISRKGISTAFCSSSRQMIVNAVIRSEDLTKFYVNKQKVNVPFDEKYPLNEWSHIINVDAIELFEHVRTVAKKDGIRIMQRINRPDFLQIQIYGNKTDGGISNIRLKTYTPVSYNINEVNRRPTTCPNVTIQLSKFCNCLLGLVKARYVKINMKIYKEGVVIMGTSSAETASRGSSFGITSSSPSDSSSSSASATALYHHMTLSSQTVSALTKMINFNNEGVVRIYSSSNGFARIESHLGCFGTVRVYLIDKTSTSVASKQ